MTTAPTRILRIHGVSDKTGLGTSSIYDRMNRKSPRYDPDFPRPVTLGIGTRAKGWPEAEIDEYVAKLIARRNAAAREGGGEA